jgi:hypothetical protein
MPDTIPLTLQVDLAGELLGYSNVNASYAAVNAGVIPTLPGPGRKKVPTAALERLVGRPITAADIDAAKARLEPKRAERLAYGTDYRNSRARLAAARG